MEQTRIIYILLAFCLFSCQDISEKTVENKTKNKSENTIEIDTSKMFQRVSIPYYDNNKIVEEYEAYISKKKDTFWNTWKFYKNGIIDSSRSKFFTFRITENKKDSIMKGKISIYSPADSIPKSKISSRKITLVFLQKENDSIITKEIKSEISTIEFDYKNFENYGFEGFVMDLRSFKLDSTPEKLLLNRNYFALDTKLSTNNVFVELLE